MNRFSQWRALVVLMSCCTFVACSSETGTKGEGAPPANATGVAADSAGAPAKAIPPNYGGAIDTISCTAISGWEWNSANPEDKISIDILVDNKLAGTTPANGLRMDLKETTRQATPHYAFSWPIPPELKDGKTHTVSARISGGTQEVQVWQNVKPSFTCSPQ